jgi:hypothetical protein
VYAASRTSWRRFDSASAEEARAIARTCPGRAQLFLGNANLKRHLLEGAAAGVPPPERSNKVGARRSGDQISWRRGRTQRSARDAANQDTRTAAAPPVR